MFSTSNPALLIVDMQLAIDTYVLHERSNPEAEQHAGRLLALWRHLQLPVVHIRHSSKFAESPYHASKPGFVFKSEVTPLDEEPIITKSENCAFLGTELENYLRSHAIQELVICGVLTNNSIDATVRVAAGVGFTVILPIEAQAASSVKLLDGRVIDAELIQQIYLSNLQGEYAVVCSMEIIENEMRKLK